MAWRCPVRGRVRARTGHRPGWAGLFGPASELSSSGGRRVLRVGLHLGRSVLALVLDGLDAFRRTLLDRVDGLLAGSRRWSADSIATSFASSTSGAAASFTLSAARCSGLDAGMSDAARRPTPKAIRPTAIGLPCVAEATLRGCIRDGFAGVAHGVLRRVDDVGGGAHHAVLQAGRGAAAPCRSGAGRPWPGSPCRRGRRRPGRAHARVRSMSAADLRSGICSSVLLIPLQRLGDLLERLDGLRHPLDLFDLLLAREEQHRGDDAPQRPRRSRPTRRSPSGSRAPTRARSTGTAARGSRRRRRRRRSPAPLPACFAVCLQLGLGELDLLAHERRDVAAAPPRSGRRARSSRPAAPTASAGRLPTWEPVRGWFGVGHRMPPLVRGWGAPLGHDWSGGAGSTGQIPWGRAGRPTRPACRCVRAVRRSGPSGAVPSGRTRSRPAVPDVRSSSSGCMRARVRRPTITPAPTAMARNTPGRRRAKDLTSCEERSRVALVEPLRDRIDAVAGLPHEVGGEAGPLPEPSAMLRELVADVAQPARGAALLGGGLLAHLAADLVGEAACLVAGLVSDGLRLLLGGLGDPAAGVAGLVRKVGRLLARCRESSTRTSPQWPQSWSSSWGSRSSFRAVPVVVVGVPVVVVPVVPVVEAPSESSFEPG